MPDTDDLRLLAEIINNGTIGLPQAAWNARMSQAEAADRFVTMAERGLPLRLVAEGDRQLLWQIAQAGPATGGFPVPAAAEPAPAAAEPAPAAAAPAPVPVPVEPPPVQQLPVVPPPPPPAPLPPAPLPPASAVPPHEQAIAGAVPLGQPPFGTPPPAAEEPAPVAAGPATGPGATWGVPGAASWARTDDAPAPPEEPSPELTQAYPPPEPGGSPEPTDPGDPGDAGDPPPATSRHAVTDDAPSPTRRVMISGQPTQNVAGLFGENLSISLQQIVDPADQILTQAGYVLDQGERALLVQTAIGNQGPIDYESLPDLYLVLVSSTGSILQKAAMAVAQFPAHRVGVPAGAHGSGWTVFLVPAATEVAEVRWSVRPDLANRTVSWGFGPA